MVIDDGAMFVPMPRQFIPSWSVNIIKASDSSTTNVSARLLKGEFVQSVFRVGIGYFMLELINVGGNYTGEWAAGDTVTFYADLTAGTTKQFEGTIDAVKEELTNNAQVLKIEGRHISYQLTETFVNATYNDDTIDTILKALVDAYLTGFTYANVGSFTTTTIRSWANKAFIDCLVDLCELGTADGYVDDDLDFHFFPENSRENKEEAFADGIPGRALVFIKDYGKDTYFEKNRITVYGEDDEGLPIIYTAGTGTRYLSPCTDKNITTVEEAVKVAEAKLAEATNVPPQAIVRGYGCPTLKPGQNCWVFSPRNEIMKKLKMIEVKHIIGSDVGMWFTEVKVEKEARGVEKQLKLKERKEKETIKVINPNNFEYTFNFTFDDDSNVGQHTNTETSDGALVLQSGQTDGTMISTTKTSDSNIIQVQLKYKGENLEDTAFEVSVNDGTNYEAIAKDQLLTVGFTGKSLKLKANLSGTSPKVYSLALLWK